MSITDIVADLWQWVRVDLIGSDILTGAIIAIYVYVLYSSLDLPVPQSIGLTLPTLLVVVLLGYIGWFGWLTLILLGLLFGVLIYKLLGVR